MKISFLADIDYANVLTEYAHLLNESPDIECKSICLKKHIFGYDLQHDYDILSYNSTQIKEVIDYIKDSDYIIFGEENSHLGTTYWMLDQFKTLTGLDIIELDSKILVWHAGSNYRNNASYYNSHPQKHKLHKSLYGIDLFRLSNKEENDAPIHIYQNFNFNYDKFISDFEIKLNKRPWTILHIPSNVNTKGTQQITESIEALDLDPNEFEYKVLQNLTHPQVIEEKKKSIFYIDQFNSNIGGYGVSTLESVITGNLTFSTINNISDSILYLTGKNEIPLVSLGATQQELYHDLVTHIKVISPELLLEYMMGIGQWMEEFYSPKAITSQFINTIC